MSTKSVKTVFFVDTPVGVCVNAGSNGAGVGGDSGVPVDGPPTAGADCTGESRGTTGSEEVGCDLLVGRSQSIVKRLAGVCTGTYFRRNFRLRSVMRLDPSTQIAYWSYWCTSITTPALSHFRGWRPV